ncbi:unnamed protein product, partial [Rotaria socialis]
FQPRIQGGGGSVSVWEIMAAEGVGPLVFYDGHMNGQHYISVIESLLLPYSEKISTKMIHGIVCKTMYHAINQILV